MKERITRVTSDARARLRDGDAAQTVDVADDLTHEGVDATTDEPGPELDSPADDVTDDSTDEATDETRDPGDGFVGKERRGSGGRLSIPLVPTLAVLLVLLLAATGYLWSTRPDASSVRTGDYVQVLEAARSGVVDLTSFDYLTLDDDIAQAKKVAVGDLQKESVDQLNSQRKALTDQQAVVNTQVVGAAVTRADDSRGTVLLVIQSTQQTKAATRPTVVRYRIQVQLQNMDGRWRLSGISGR
jgi:hypothetical protein